MKGYRGETGINLILPDRLQSCLLLVKLLVYPEGEMFKGNSENGKLIYHINDIGIDGMFNDDNDLLSGVSRALCLDQVGQNDGKANTNIEVVLHHKVFLAKKKYLRPNGQNIEDNDDKKTLDARKVETPKSAM